jgi:hypothetical protein
VSFRLVWSTERLYLKKWTKQNKNLLHLTMPSLTLGKCPCHLRGYGIKAWSYQKHCPCYSAMELGLEPWPPGAGLLFEMRCLICAIFEIPWGFPNLSLGQSSSLALCYGHLWFCGLLSPTVQVLTPLWPVSIQTWLVVLISLGAAMWSWLRILGLWRKLGKVKPWEGQIQTETSECSCLGWLNPGCPRCAQSSLFLILETLAPVKQMLTNHTPLGGRIPCYSSK